MKHVPISHLELIDGPYVVALTTVMPDGQPQTTPVWCNSKEGYIFINVMKGFAKKRISSNPKVSLLAYDPKNPLHNEIRGCVSR
jgi:general stress protein 26